MKVKRKRTMDVTRTIESLGQWVTKVITWDHKVSITWQISTWSKVKEKKWGSFCNTHSESCRRCVRVISEDDKRNGRLNCREPCSVCRCLQSADVLVYDSLKIRPGNDLAKQGDRCVWCMRWLHTFLNVRVYYCSSVKRDVLWMCTVSCGLGDIPELYQIWWRSVSCITDYSKEFTKSFFCIFRHTVRIAISTSSKWLRI